MRDRSPTSGEVTPILKAIGNMAPRTTPITTGARMWNRSTYQRRHHEKVMNSNSPCESALVTIVKPATFRFLDSKKPSDIAGRRMSNFLQGYAFYTGNGFSD